MKRLPFLFACVTVFIISSVFSAYAADVKIGLIDTQTIIMQSEKIAKYRAEFSKELEGKRQDFLKKQGEVQALENEIKAQVNSMTNEVYREKTDKLRNEARDLKRMQEEFEAELKAKEAEMTRKFLRQIKDVTVEYLEKEKLTLIFEKSTAVASDDAIDITDQIMKLFDSKP
ncbi:MAG: OmpH family outer membrane protein [Deltaproteobacteria bacterium]|nr:OmpH family outer membrane protein [Deltaproteobacteria bacterium]